MNSITILFWNASTKNQSLLLTGFQRKNGFFGPTNLKSWLLKYTERSELQTHIYISVSCFVSISVSGLAYFLGLNWHYFDSMFSLFLCVAILRSIVIPDGIYFGKILMQVAPDLSFNQIEKCLAEASTIEGILECKNEHFWSLSETEVYGSLIVRVRSDTDEKPIQAKLQQLFRKYVNQMTIQIEKEDWALSDFSKE